MEVVGFPVAQRVTQKRVKRGTLRCQSVHIEWVATSPAADARLRKTVLRRLLRSCEHRKAVRLTIGARHADAYVESVFPVIGYFSASVCAEFLLTGKPLPDRQTP